MAAIAPITVADGKATPENHTFNPIETVPPLFRENGDTTIPADGQNAVVMAMRPAQGISGVHKTSLTLRVPVLETVSGSTIGGYTPSPAVAYFMQAKVEFLLPARTTGAQRKDLRVLMQNLLANAQVVALVDTLEKPY